MKKQWQIISLMAVGVLFVAGLAVWSAMQSPEESQSPVSMKHYQGKSFSIEVPQAATVSGQLDKVSFTISKGKTGVSDDFKKAIDSAQGTFGVQVFCSQAENDVDTLAQMDRDYDSGKGIDGYSITKYTKTTIGSQPARVFEYENNFHKIISSAVQKGSITCLVASYVPISEESTWRPVAEWSIRSLTIKD